MTWLSENLRYTSTYNPHIKDYRLVRVKQITRQHVMTPITTNKNPFKQVKVVYLTVYDMF